MPSKQKQAYPQRRPLKYKKDCPWEVEQEEEHEPYIKLTPEEWAERRADYERQERAAAPRIRAILLTFFLIWLACEIPDFLSMAGRGGWGIGNIIGGALYLAVICTVAWCALAVLKEMFMGTDEEDDGEDDPPSPPMLDEEQEQQKDNEQQQQYEVSQQVSEKERIRAYKFRLEREKHLRMLEEQRKKERERREEEVRIWEAEEAGESTEGMRMSEDEIAAFEHHMREEERDYYLGKYGVDIDTLDDPHPADMGCTMGGDESYDPDNEHDTSMDYGIGEDIFDEEE